MAVMMRGSLVLVAVVLVQLVLGAVAVAGGKVVPAVYVFGDSTLDVGNNNRLEGKEVPRADKPFYGVDLPGAGGRPHPTGRFSNGYNIADFVAKSLGFEKSPLAYLVLKARRYLIPSALVRGVNYASAGAGILDSTNAGKNIPLSKQVRDFASTKAAMEAAVGARKVSDLLAGSFFLLGAGSNDVFRFVATQNALNRTTTAADVSALYSTLITAYAAAITDLYSMGARKFGIINVGPIGCVPSARVVSPTGACADGLNRLAAGFAAALKSALAAQVAPKLPGFAYSLGDSMALTLATLADPAASGFVSVDSACCGSGRLGGEGDCMRNATLCANRDAYVFWDRVHSTQRAAELGAKAFFDGPAQYTEPISFRQLAHHTA